MPRLWSQTIDEHRRDVTQAILDTTWQLVAERGALSITMSQIAEQTGIGRATLYKYFPNVEAILVAHHQRHVDDHVEELNELRNGPGGPAERLTAVLMAYARICYHREQHAPSEVFALVHRGEHVVEAEQRITTLFQELLTDARAAGDVRDDAAPAELAAYCLHALSAAGSLRSEAAVRRLVTVTLAGLRASDAAPRGSRRGPA
jgi:AcrR family transcriptional regulator